MITAIEIENFKGIGERTRVEIKPITLLFGPNSVGKSTILHAMQLAREILTRGNVDADKLEGGSLDLGGFRHYVHNHDVTKTVRLRFELDMSREDLLTEFPVPEYRITVPHLPDEDKEDISSIGDEVFDAWVELEINCQALFEWVELKRYAVERPLTAIVSSLMIGLNGEPFARMTVQPARALTMLNLRHSLVAWDRIAEDSVGRLDALWPDTRPINDTLFFSGEPVAWEDLESPAEGMIVCKAPITQAEDESDWIYRASGQHIDLGGVEVHGDQLYAASPDGKYLRRWGIRYSSEQADAEAGRKYVENDMPTALFPEDKSTFCRPGCREVEDWATLDESISMRGPMETPPNLLRRLAFEPRPRSMFEWDDPTTRTERFGVYVALLNRLLLGPLSVLRRELTELRHVGPVREPVPRNHRPRRFTDPSHWLGGLAAWDGLARDAALASQVGRWMSEEDRLNTGYRTVCDYFREAPANFYWISKAFKEGEDEDPTKGKLDIEKTQEYYDSLELSSRVMLQPIGKAILLQPADLGQGITQMVPVVTAALMPGTPGEKPKGTLVAVEQPELHVHPRQQAAIGDVFIAALGDPGNRFLIETHSEHLMLRLLRRIRETSEGTLPKQQWLRPPKNSLTPNDVSVLYVKARSDLEPGQSGIVIHTLRVDEEGDLIDEFPGGFFPERLRELR